MQTHCFVCNESFDKVKKEIDQKADEEQSKKKAQSKYYNIQKSNKHLHHNHIIDKNNMIDYACVRCNLQMTEKRRAGIPVIFHNGSHYD